MRGAGENGRKYMPEFMKPKALSTVALSTVTKYCQHVRPPDAWCR
jgi:hypothetical protein